ncbi:MAG: hypothetical protein AABY32_06760 [Nanoarchaeota archaeon]
MTKRILSKLLNFVAWLTGVLVSLAVAFGMIDGVLAIRWIPHTILAIFGWIVVATTLISVIIGIFKTFSKN